MTAQFREGRLELLVAYGRVLVGLSCLLAILLDPPDPPRYSSLTFQILSLYVIYAGLLAIWVGRSKFLSQRICVHVHGVDLLAFTVFQYFTEGPSSPFFFLFTFALLAAVFRWNKVGLIWTASITTTVFFLLGFVGDIIMGEALFELNRFVMRSTYLVGIAIFLGFATAYDERRRAELRRLAIWAHSPGDTFEGILLHAAEVLRSPNVFLLWREGGEKQWHRLDWTIQANAAARHLDKLPIGLGDLQPSPFLCSRDNRILEFRSGSLENNVGGESKVSCIRGLAADSAVLALPFRHAMVEGWLFGARPLDFHPDELFIGGLVARQLAVALENERLTAQVRVDERMRLARDLHDGALQSLTGATLRMEALRLSASKPHGEPIRQIQQLVSAAHHDLRLFVGILREHDAVRESADLSVRLEALGAEMGLHWGVAVQVRLEGAAQFDETMNNDIYLIAHEAVTNAAKHGSATFVEIAMTRADDSAIRITISDNGCGFGFVGHLDDQALSQRDLGPLSIRQRVAALAGSLRLDSSDTGARLEILLPLTQ